MSDRPSAAMAAACAGQIGAWAKDGLPQDLSCLHRAVDEVMGQRCSIRAFLPRPVPLALINEILGVAARAPSGNNIQPWRVHVVCGAERQRLVGAVWEAFDQADGSHREEYPYYPAAFVEPFLSRRRQTGWGLYGQLGIAKGERARMQVQHRRNFQFFDAPVGLMFTIDRSLAQGSWLDYGMFLQNVMLAATARGLGTCAQAAWNDYHRIIAEVLAFDPREQLVCGMALGYADPQAPENRYRPDRVTPAEFVRVHGAGEELPAGAAA